jgi:hypothetical protein
MKPPQKRDEAEVLSALSKLFAGYHYREAFHLIAEYVGITTYYNLGGSIGFAVQTAEGIKSDIVSAYTRCQAIADAERELHGSGKHKEKKK